jgi:hypothetical protein
MIKNILLLIIITIFSLKISDIIFDKFYNPAVQIFGDSGVQRNLILKEYNPNKKAILVPPSHILSNTNSVQKKKYALNIDQNGFIRNGNTLKKSTSNKDKSIILFGSSTTESLYVSEINRFPSVLERNLSQIFEKNINVYNAGVSGNHSLHSLLSLIGKGIQIKPDYAVLMHNANDLSLLRKTGSYWIAPGSRSIIQVVNGQPQRKNSFYLIGKEIKNFLIPNLYGFIRAKIRTSPTSNDDFREFRGQKINFNDVKKMYQSSIRSFVHIARAWDIEPVLMTQFNRINIKNDDFLKSYKDTDVNQFIKEYQMLNKVIRDIAKSENVLIVDLATKIPSDKKYIYDSTHLTEKGSLLVAKILTNFFVAELQNE